MPLLILGIIVGASLLLGLMFVSIFNKLVGLRNKVRNAFSQIDVQLKRRHDLIPNLVETAKGYLQHEKLTLEAVIAARNMAVSARESAVAGGGAAASIQALALAEQGLATTMSRFLGLAEAYPDLKANTTMAQLMEQLTSTENRVAFARQAYNDSVMFFNTAIQTFPNNLLAPAMGFSEASAFRIEDVQERSVPSVALNP